MPPETGVHIPEHIVVVQAPTEKVGEPWKPALHTHVPAPPVASPVHVERLSAYVG